MRTMALLLGSGLALAAQGWVLVEGTQWTTRLNEVRKPAQGGTTVDLQRLLGDSTTLGLRVEGSWNLSERQSVRLLLAPFEVQGTGVLSQATRYRNTVFQPGVPTEATYRFNSWRGTWVYHWKDTSVWSLDVGATAKIRDAKVALRQGDRVETESNLGFVPLAHLQATWKLTPKVQLVFQTDTLAGGPGRAIDAVLMARWQGSRGWFGDVGYRLLEGGADTDSLYTWARLDGWRIGVGRRF